MFKTPHLKNGVALNLIGKPGTGKPIIIDEFLIPFIFGEDKCISVAGIDKLTQEHNSTLGGQIFISINELLFIYMNKVAQFEVLKTLISGKDITIEPKNVDPHKIKNYTRLFLCTKNDMSLYLQEGDRRYFVLEVSDRHKNDIDYFYTLSKSFTEENSKKFLVIAIIIIRHKMTE